ESNVEQQVKATISGAKLTLDTKELGLEAIVKTLDERLSASKAPVKQLLHSMTAELFQQYYSSQYYKISQRTNLESFDTGDIRTWAPNNYRDYIAEQYLLSTSEATREYKTENFKKLLSNENTVLDLRPALYDLLVDRAINYFSTKDYNVITPSFGFSLDSPDYFGAVDSFIELEILSEEKDSKLFRAIKLFQEQLKYQATFSDQKVLASYDLKRLDFVRSISDIADVDSLFEKSLAQSSTYYKGTIAHPFVIRLAQVYVNSERYEEALGMLDKLSSDSLEGYISAQKQNLINSINHKHLALQSEQVVPSKSNFLINVTSRNLEQVYFKLLKVNEKDFADLMNSKQEEQYKKIENFPILKQWNSENLRDGYKQSSYEEIIAGLDLGRYIIVSSNSDDFKKESSSYHFTAFFVSDLAYTSYGQFDGKKLFVRNRSTGKPVSNVEVEVYTREYNREKRKNELKLVQTAKSDSDGWLDIIEVKNNSFQYKLTKGNDVLNLEVYDYFHRQRKADYTSEKTEIFIDRAIYRPGQIVHFKTLSLNINQQGLPTIHEGKKLVVNLKDANGQQVETLEVKSNDYGSASGSFILPVGRLTGSFSIEVDHGRKSFSVEEYKRPKFEVEIDTPKGELSLGDLVEFSGLATALSGSPISDAKVQYTIMRQTYYGWWSWYRRVPSSSEMVEQGVAKTDQSGKFMLDFTAEADANMKLEENPTYSYEVSVDVTDLSGETRSATETISISALPYSYAIVMDEIIDIKDLTAIKVKAVTSNDVSLKSDAIFKVIELQQPDVWKRNRRWTTPSNPLYKRGEFEKKIDRIGYNNISVLSEYDDKKVVFEGKLDIPVNGVNVDVSKYVKGGKAYRIEIISNEKYKNTKIIAKDYIAVTDSKNNKYPTLVLLYVNPKTKVAKVGEKYEVNLGTPDNELQVYYTFIRDQEIVHKGIADVDNNFTVCYEPTEKDRGGITLFLDYVKHNYYKRVQQSVNLPWDHKKLNVELVTKRDKVLPGSKEEWMLKISGPDKDKAIAEVLATMYDASLDQFVKHEFSFSPYISHYGHFQSQAFGFDYGYSGELNYQWNRVQSDRVNLPGIPALKGMEIGYSMGYLYDGQYETMSRSQMKRGNAATAHADGVMAAAPMMEESAMMSSSVESEQDMEGGSPNNKNEPIGGEEIKPTKEISVRKNLDESVFFYPNLKTDVDGNLLISFTMNEALTTWKLLTFAHDKDLRYGMTSHEVKTQKDVMILPNAPRFLREGDRLVFPATVSNLSSEDLSVTTHLELINPETNKVINDVFGLNQNQSVVKVAKGESARVDWEINVPSNYKKLVKYRVTAVAGDHTDGEENILPVVTNQILLTETKVVSVKKQEKKSFLFDALSNGSATSQPHRYTFEYTSNPIWYAVQALPYLMEYPHQCTEQIFNRMYANTLASHIANANPKIKQVFEEWKVLDSDALLSNLEKNSELKSAILEETPWVRQAKSETEQKKRIALL
ncbi:MAG: 5-hydroxyisourate hydrolase-like protein (transthyretin family), partial [Saprospiraceae bacterium]